MYSSGSNAYARLTRTMYAHDTYGNLMMPARHAADDDDGAWLAACRDAVVVVMP